jgi:transcriptional regulator with XRE-family HTH domain
MGRATPDPIVVHLSAARVAQRLSQRAVAVRMFMGQASGSRLSILEGGRRVPGLAVVRRWARALGFDLALVPYQAEVADATETLMAQLEQLLAELDQTRVERDYAQALLAVRPAQQPSQPAVPAGCCPEIEWASQAALGSGSRVTSAPHYRREHAERERGHREYLVRRQVYAGPWEPVDEQVENERRRPTPQPKGNP